MLKIFTFFLAKKSSIVNMLVLNADLLFILFQNSAEKKQFIIAIQRFLHINVQNVLQKDLFSRIKAPLSS